MGIIETFVSFAQRLSGERRAAVEADLADLMARYSGEHEFSVKELSELDRRVAEPEPAYASADQMEELLGKRYG